MLVFPLIYLVRMWHSHSIKNIVTNNFIMTNYEMGRAAGLVTGEGPVANGVFITGRPLALFGLWKFTMDGVNGGDGHWQCVIIPYYLVTSTNK